MNPSMIYVQWILVGCATVASAFTMPLPRPLVRSTKCDSSDNCSFYPSGMSVLSPPIGHTSSSSSSSSSQLFADPKEDNDNNDLDLDLEEMFTMFEAADKEEKFDDAIKKVKEE